MRIVYENCISLICVVHFCTQNYHSLMLGYQKGKMAENRAIKELVKQRKHNLPFAKTESFKNQDNHVKRKREAGIFSKSGRFSAKIKDCSCFKS